MRDDVIEQKSLLEHLKSVAGSKGRLSYKDYIKKALYHPKWGYYAKKRKRIGREADTDFYTAQSLGDVFNELLIAGVDRLLGSEKLEDYTFVELAAEGTHPILDENSPLPFKAYQPISFLDEIEIPEKAVVFANELLDAQPFNRLVFKDGQWRELGVAIGDDLTLTEVVLDAVTEEVQTFIKELPKEHMEGYTLDIALDAEVLLEKMVSAKWEGLLVLFDYGHAWEGLLYNYPEGTARGYYRHKQTGDLLSNPGSQDLTCHVCWDRFSWILEKHGFGSIGLERQEAFFMKYAAQKIEAILRDSAAFEVNKRKQTLKELIHPTHMGHKFQVLHGLRSK